MGCNGGVWGCMENSTDVQEGPRRDSHYGANCSAAYSGRRAHDGGVSLIAQEAVEHLDTCRPVLLPSSLTHGGFLGSFTHYPPPHPTPPTFIERGAGFGRKEEHANQIMHVVGLSA